MKICGKCRCKVPDDALYCCYCGVRFKTAEELAAPSEAIEVAIPVAIDEEPVEA